MKCCDLIAIVLTIVTLIHSGSTRPNEAVDTNLQTNPLEAARVRELVASAEANETYAALALDVFKRKHSGRVVQFDNLREKSVSWLLPIELIDGEIIVRQIDYALALLRHFGHLIPSIEFHHSDLYIARSHPSDIYNHLNLYCADSLKSLKLNTLDKHLFSGMTKPFTTVHSLSIEGRFKSFASETLTLSQLFPNVRELYLSPDLIKDKNSIDLAIPNLETLSIAIHYKDLNEEDFEKFLRKNVQIRKLSVSYSSPKFIHIINEILPNITDLRLLDYNKQFDDESPVTFKYVTKFAVSMRLGNLPQNIFFENLKELRVESFPSRDWLFLVERNPHLEILFFENGLIYNEQFEKMIASNLDLREVSLSIDHSVTDENVITFVRNHKNANRLCFKTWGKHLEQYAELGNVLQNELGDAFKVSTGENILVIEMVRSL